MIKSGIIIFLLSFLYLQLNAAELILSKNEQYLNAYYTQMDKVGWEVELKGIIISTGARDYSHEDEMAKQLQDKSKVTVRLYDNLGVNKGDILYIINSKNLIIGKLIVTSIFKTKTFGYILSGEGNLQLVSLNDRVVRRIESVTKYPFLYNSKGDYYYENGRLGEAISQYKNAIQADKSNPEAHINLGYIYMQQQLLQLAVHEFMEAEKHKSRIIDNEDKYFLYKGITEVRFREAYYTRLPYEIRNRYISEGIEYSLKALEIYPDSTEVNFYLGVFYYKNSNPVDVKAKEQFLKVISLDENNIEAYIALSELYDKHKNRNKAISYAEKALTIDPANDRAKFILNKLK